MKITNKIAIILSITLIYLFSLSYADLLLGQTSKKIEKIVSVNANSSSELTINKANNISPEQVVIQYCLIARAGDFSKLREYVTSTPKSYTDRIKRHNRIKENQTSVNLLESEGASPTEPDLSPLYNY